MATGSDPVGLRSWVGDLTYKEVHAATYGAAHGAGTVVAYLLGLNAVAIALVLTLFVLNGWMKTERTKDFPLVSSIYEALPNSIVGQIRDELHYYDGFYIGAAVVAYAGSFLV